MLLCCFGGGVVWCGDAGVWFLFVGLGAGVCLLGAVLLSYRVVTGCLTGLPLRGCAGGWWWLLVVGCGWSSFVL